MTIFYHLELLTLLQNATTLGQKVLGPKSSQLRAEVRVQQIKLWQRHYEFASSIIYSLHSLRCHCHLFMNVKWL